MTATHFPGLDFTRMCAFLKRFEAYMPVLPLCFLGYLFLAADFFPAVSADTLGLVWQECRLAGETYATIPNQQQVESCFGGPGPELKFGDEAKVAQSHVRLGLIHQENAYQINGKQVAIARMGIKYFLMVDGHKVGPTFDSILVDSTGDDPQFSAQYGQGHYVFRGARGGKYYLVEISRLLTND